MMSDYPRVRLSRFRNYLEIIMKRPNYVEHKYSKNSLSYENSTQVNWMLQSLLVRKL